MGVILRDIVAPGWEMAAAPVAPPMPPESGASRALGLTATPEHDEEYWRQRQQMYARLWELHLWRIVGEAAQEAYTSLVEEPGGRAR